MRHKRRRRKKKIRRLLRKLLWIAVTAGVLFMGGIYLGRDYQIMDLDRLSKRMELQMKWKLYEIGERLTGTIIGKEAESIQLEEIPEYQGEPYVRINGNVPFFKETDFTEEIFENYGELDVLGRCTEAFANVGLETMPIGERGDISQVIPSGWINHAYDFIDGGYLWNRCHLIGFQLTAENANENNLITGSRYLNIEGMLPFEDMVANYVYLTGNHVLYRVTPIFDGVNLVANGVLMEGLSVEDRGSGVSFCVYCYNVQPGVTIDYLTGDNEKTTPREACGVSETVL